MTMEDKKKRNKKLWYYIKKKNLLKLHLIEVEPVGGGIYLRSLNDVIRMSYHNLLSFIFYHAK